MPTPDRELGLRRTVALLLDRRHAGGFWLLNLVNLGDNIAYFGMLTLLTRYLGDRLGAPDAATGISVSFYTGLVTLTMLGGGFLSDRLGVRRSVSLGLFLEALGRTLLWTAPMFQERGLAVAWLGLLLAAVGCGVIQPALYAGVKQYTEPETATLGYSLLYSTMTLGIGVAALLSPWIRTDAVLGTLGGMAIRGLGWGLDGVFLACAAITWVTLGIHLLLFTPALDRDPPRTAESARFDWSSLPLLDAGFMVFIFILLPVRTLFAHQFLTLPDYVFRAFPVSVSNHFEWIVGLNPPIVLVLVPLFAALTRKAKVVDMMILGTGVCAITTFLLAGPPQLSHLVFYVILFSVGEALWGSRFLEYVADLAPPGKVGAYMGLAGIPWFMAKFTTGLYSGWMLDRFLPVGGVQEPGTLWLIYAGIACLTPVGLVLCRGWLLRREVSNEDDSL